jgi:trimeric autotransporter adhesin
LKAGRWKSTTTKTITVKKILTIFSIIVVFAGACDAQSVGVGTSSPNASAQLDVSSSSRGLLIPRMDSNAVKAIASPATGLMVYDTSRNELMVNTGTAVLANWQNLVATSGWQLGGNNVTASQAFGTLNNVPLQFVVQGKTSGEIDSVRQNVFLGYGSGAIVGTSNRSTALGDHALVNGGTGDVAIGSNTLDSAADFDVAIGWNAMAYSTGTQDVAVGMLALQYDKGGSNTGIGAYALENNSTGYNNTAVGNGAGAVNTTGQANTLVGLQAATNNASGNQNTAVGFVALGSSQTGDGNTAIGFNALRNTSGAFYNTAVGSSAGTTYNNGYNNVFVGANNDVNGAGYYNVIAIGQGVICTASSQARFGNSATNSIGGYADWTNFSDGRYKKNMKEGVKGLDFIMRLRPITYNLDVTGIRNHLGQKAPSDAGTQQSIAEREAMLFSGFAAQEVEAAASASGYDFSGVDKPRNANDFYGLRYGDFVVPLVKAVQEQQQMIVALQQKTTALEEQNKLLMQLIKKQ